MSNAISVNKQNVKQLLESGKNSKFIIPEYQRPYAWSDEQIQTLFDDLVEYTKQQNLESEKESNYFLGTIVFFENEDEEKEIIDGQQRITSLFLLLRAIYSKLESMTETAEVKNFKAQIESALWEQDELTAQVNYDEILIESRVMNNEGNKIFADILKTGQTGKSRDNYTANYILFSELIEKYTNEEPELFFWFIRNVLSRAILLPIRADSQDTALTIFSTLNDRGLALSDADIFKAKMYNKLEPQEKDKFIERWQKLDEDASNANENIQKLFYYYMFYLRALEGDRKTTTPGMRKYYARNSFDKLHNPNVLNDLENIMILWIAINNRIEVEGYPWTENMEIKQVLDSLLSYPNEFWKYPVVIYYLKYHRDTNFEPLFLRFLRKLFTELSAKYIVTPTINAVKTSILNLNLEIIKSPEPKFVFPKIDLNDLKSEMVNPHRNTVRMILKAISYESQDSLLPEKWEIEHILPRKWQSSYFPNRSDEEIEEIVENIGNKIPFEKKLNIIASNGYFNKKRESYKESKIQVVLDLYNEHNDWGIEDINERNIRISDKYIGLLKKWGLNNDKYLIEDVSLDDSTELTEEEILVIRSLKNRGINLNDTDFTFVND